MFLPIERIEARIYVFRGKKVMLDRDLAGLYGMPTKVLNQAVRRNPERFPGDFMFELSLSEAEILRSQFVTSNDGRGGRRYKTVAFTEQGVAMLSSVLKSPRAVAVNIQIMRTFTKLREILMENADLRLKIEAMEKQYDEQFRIVFDAIKRLMDDNEPNEDRVIGFRT